MFSKRYILQISTALLLAVTSFTAAQETTIDIKGLNTLSKKEVLILLGDRAEYIKNRPPGPSRADDAAFLLEQVLLKRGFQDAEVTWQIDTQARKIILNVKEGKKTILGNIRFIKDSNDFSSETLQNYFLQPLKDRFVPLEEEEIPILTENIEQARKNLEAFLHSQGYWKASVLLVDTSVNRFGSSDITLQVNIRKKHTLGELDISGLPPAYVSELRAEIDPYIAAPATTENIRSISAELRKLVNSKGYQFSKIKSKRMHDGNTTTIQYKIDLGQRYKLREVIIEGLEKTNPKRITNRFKKSQGDFYDSAAIDKTIRRIFATGAFNSLRSNTIPNNDETVDLVLTAEEGRARGVEAYLGLGSYEGFIFGSTFFDRNFLGSLRNFSLTTEITSLGFLGEVRLSDPWLLEKNIKTTPRAYVLSRNFEGYSKTDTGAGIEFEWKPSKHHTLQLGYDVSFVNLNPDGLPSSAIGDEEYFLQTIGIRNLFDHRDNAVLPKDGHYIELNTQLGFSTGDDQIGFFKFEAKSGYYEPITEKGTIALGLRGGVLIPTSDLETLPIDIRFFNGGANSVRSFPEREMGEQINGFPLGGQSYWVFNAEYIHEVSSILNGVLFFDAGGISRRYEDFGSTDPKFAVGAGLRIDLPVGPVRFEYGYNLNREEGEPSGAFHFTIGARF